MNPENDDEKVTYLGETDARNRRLRFGIKKKDRAKHLYAIGKTGMGKSTLLENLAVQDIMSGEGVCFIDPHGKSADLLLEYVPEHRIKDVIYFAPFDMDNPVSFNVMEDVGPEQRYLVASGMMSAFKKIWVDAWSARMEYILGNIMLALLEFPGSTLVGVNRMLTDKDFRKEVVNHISDPSVKSFWVNEYANYTEKFAAEAAPAIQNKVGQFIANPLIRNIIGQPKSSFDIREVMDNKKILIINLSKGRVGEANANLLGAMLITKIYLGAMSRADLNEKQLAAAPNFYLYVDEFQSFANETFADILSEARKYKLNLHIAHQYIEQMTDEVRAAVFGNVGTMCIFRVGSYDAEVLEKEFAPYFTAEDIVNLQKYQMYLKLMIDGVTSQPFSASGLSPAVKPEINYTNEILASSRANYARPRQQVEDELLAWIQKKFGQGGGSSGGDRPSGAGERSNGGGNGGGSSGGGGSRDGGGRDRNSGGSNSGGGGYRGDSRGGSGGERSSGGYNGGGDRSGGNRSGGNYNGPGGSTKTSSNSGGYNGSSNSGGSSTGSYSRSSSSSASTYSPATTTPPPSSATLAPTPTSVSAPSPAPRQFQNTQTSRAPQVSQREPNRDAQPQPISSELRPNSIPNSKAPKNDQREQDLRKAMSLSYLKPEPPVQKDKTPKPENIAALRDALLSVMKTGDMNSAQNVNSTPVNHTPVNSSHTNPAVTSATEKVLTHHHHYHKDENRKHQSEPEQNVVKVDSNYLKEKEQETRHAPYVEKKTAPVSSNSQSSSVSSLEHSSYPSSPQIKEVDQSELNSIFAE
jgi:Type IV secretion-system coupling protein DNA-binding domain